MVEMAQGLSLSTLTTSCSSGVYGSIPSWRAFQANEMLSPYGLQATRHSLKPVNSHPASYNRLLENNIYN